MNHPIKKGSPAHLAERRRYLNALTQEFLGTYSSIETQPSSSSLKKKMASKNRITEIQEELLANLANFAYDPYNLVMMREIGVHHRVFLRFLQERINSNSNLSSGSKSTASAAGIENIPGPGDRTKSLEFALAGLLNSIVHPETRTDIVARNGFETIMSLYSLLENPEKPGAEAITITSSMMSSIISLITYMLEPHTVQILLKLKKPLSKLITFNQKHPDPVVRNTLEILKEHLRRMGLGNDSELMEALQPSS